MDKSDDTPADIPSPASSEDESLLMGLAGLEVDALHADRLERDDPPPRRAAIPLAGPSPVQAGPEVAAAPAPPAGLPSAPAERAAPAAAAAQDQAGPDVAAPPGPASAQGQYRSDRPRRGADFAWPKEVLELVQTAPKEAGEPLDKAEPAPESGGPTGVMTPGATARGLPFGGPESPLQTPIPAGQNLRALPLPARRVPRPAPRHGIDLLIQLICIAAGAWAAVLLAWLIL